MALPRGLTGVVEGRRKPASRGRIARTSKSSIARSPVADAQVFQLPAQKGTGCAKTDAHGHFVSSPEIGAATSMCGRHAGAAAPCAGRTRIAAKHPSRGDEADEPTRESCTERSSTARHRRGRRTCPSRRGHGALLGRLLDRDAISTPADGCSARRVSGKTEVYVTTAASAPHDAGSDGSPGTVALDQARAGAVRALGPTSKLVPAATLEALWGQRPTISCLVAGVDVAARPGSRITLEVTDDPVLGTRWESARSRW
jgi:hypothetical protein